MDFKIRNIEIRDSKFVFEQLYKLAEHGDSTHCFVITKEMMQEQLFGEKASWNGLVAVAANKNILGCCMYNFTHFSRMYNKAAKIFIDAIYIEPQARNKNIATQFMKQIIQIAKNKKISAIELWCMNDNEIAKTFYRKSGLIEFDSFNLWRLKLDGSVIK